MREMDIYIISYIWQMAIGNGHMADGNGNGAYDMAMGIYDMLKPRP